MSSESPDSPPLPFEDAEVRKAGLGQSAFHGFALITASAVGVKCFALLSQIVVARILTPHDFGTVALAYSVLAFTGVLQKDGLREILVQRGRRFASYANAAFWMSLATGVLVAALTLAAIPFAIRIYRVPALGGVLALFALGTSLLSLQSVPNAQLHNDMRFKTLALIGALESVFLNTFTMLLATLGAGMYSIVAPTVAVRAASLAWQWRLTRFAPALSMDWPRWRDLLAASGLLLGSAALYAVNLAGASMVLGISHEVATVGIFSFSYSLCAQLTGLVTNNLWAVLLPAFSRLQDTPARQKTAFLRVTRATNLVGMPVCFLLAALADPALRLLYGRRWEGAIQVVQIVSLGMAFNISFALSNNLLTAQGRYLSLFWFNLWGALGFILLVSVGAWWNGAVGVGAATALFALIAGPAITHLAIRPAGGTWKEVWGVHALPLAVGGVACGLAASAAAVMPAIHERKWLHLAFVPVLSLIIGLPLSRWWMPATWDELAGRLRQLVLARSIRRMA